MTQYEKLLQTALQDGAEVIDYHFNSDRIKGLYCDNTIAINNRLTTTEKACVLAEELGHHHTSSGNILDQHDVGNRKQEQRARLWAYKKMVTKEKLIAAFEAGCRNRYEIADYIDVTEEFLQEALSRYQEIYGGGVQVHDYLIVFNPLRIARII